MNKHEFSIRLISQHGLSNCVSRTYLPRFTNYCHCSCERGQWDLHNWHTVMERVNLLVSQCTPDVPIWHVHVYPLAPSLHRPLFWHGLLEHSFISENSKTRNDLPQGVTFISITCVSICHKGENIQHTKIIKVSTTSWFLPLLP